MIRTYSFVWSIGVALLVGGAIMGSPSIPNPHETADDSLQKAISTYLTAIETKGADVHRGAQKIAQSFFLRLFLDDTIPKSEHRIALKQMAEKLKAELEGNPGALDAENIKILIDEFRSALAEVRESDEHQHHLWGQTYLRSVPETAALDILGRTVYRGWRNRDQSRSALKSVPKPRPESKARPRRAPKDWKTLCRDAMGTVGAFAKRNKSLAWHFLIAIPYSFPNYYWKFRPLFWGINDNEPWDPSEDEVNNEILPYLEKKLNSSQWPSSSTSDYTRDSALFYWAP